MTPTADKSSATAGLFYGLAAYLSWGVIPLYFHAIEMVEPRLVLAHRITWSVAFLAMLLTATRQWGSVRSAIFSRRTLLAMLGSTVMIAANWYAFIWCINNHRAVDASFGYFINPLVNISLGVLVLRERLRPPQLTAVGLASVGVGWMTYAMGGVLPLPSLVLAVSFGMYGLIRKTAPVRPLVGLSIETAILLPAAVAVMIWHKSVGEGLMYRGGTVATLLLLSGVVTALPLIWFAAAAKRLQLATLGLLQYFAPTCQLLIAVLIFGEPFDRKRLISFGFIWVALIVFTADAIWRASRRQEPAARIVPGEQVASALATCPEPV